MNKPKPPLFRRVLKNLYLPGRQAKTLGTLTVATLLIGGFFFVLPTRLDSARLASARTSMTSALGGFHIQGPLLEQPDTSVDWGLFGSLTNVGIDIVSGGEGWRFIPASKDEYKNPIATLNLQGDFTISGILTAKGLNIPNLTLSTLNSDTATIQILSTTTQTTDTLNIKDSNAQIFTTSDTSQKGNAAIAYNPTTGIWMLRNSNGYFSEITTESTDSTGGGGSSLSEADVEAFIFDADNTGTLSSGTLALDSLTLTGTLPDARLSANVSLLGSAIEKGELVGTGTLGFTWGDSEISDTLTIGASSTVADGALSANVSLLGSAIEKGELAGTGTLGFTWGDSEISDTITASNYLPLAGGTLTGALTLSADPTTALGAATKQYVDGSGGVGDLQDYQFVRKTVNESVTSSTTPQDDDEIFLAVGANEVWAWEILISFGGPNAGGFGVEMTAPTGASGYWWLIDDANTSDTPLWPGRRFPYGSKGNVGVGDAEAAFMIRGLLINGSTAGNLQMQWAQWTSDTSATTVYKYTHMIARRVN